MKQNVLIWGKTYPNLSDTHRETVCTGGSLIESGKPVRLYPIRMRYLPELEQFSLYDVVRIDVRPSTSDSRPESCKLIHPRVEKLYHVSTNNGWIERHRIIHRDTSWHYDCFDHLRQARERSKASLGFVKVRSLDNVEVEKRPEEERVAHMKKLEKLQAQPDLLEGEVKTLDFFPYRFRVWWHCMAADCEGHHAMVLDWGLGQLARKRDTSAAVAKMESLGDLDRYDLGFFMGNYKAHPQNFGVVALWYPLRADLERALLQGALL